MFHKVIDLMKLTNGVEGNLSSKLLPVRSSDVPFWMALGHSPVNHSPPLTMMVWRSVPHRSRTSHHKPGISPAVQMVRLINDITPVAKGGRWQILFRTTRSCDSTHCPTVSPWGSRWWSHTLGCGH